MENIERTSQEKLTRPRMRLIVLALILAVLAGFTYGITTEKAFAAGRPVDVKISYVYRGSGTSMNDIPVTGAKFQAWRVMDKGEESYVPAKSFKVLSVNWDGKTEISGNHDAAEKFMKEIRAKGIKPCAEAVTDGAGNASLRLGSGKSGVYLIHQVYSSAGNSAKFMNAEDFLIPVSESSSDEMIVHPKTRLKNRENGRGSLVKKPSAPVKTGDDGGIRAWLLLTWTGAAGVYALLRLKKTG